MEIILQSFKPIFKVIILQDIQKNTFLSRKNPTKRYRYIEQSTFNISPTGWQHGFDPGGEIPLPRDSPAACGSWRRLQCNRRRQRRLNPHVRSDKPSLGRTNLPPNLQNPPIPVRSIPNGRPPPQRLGQHPHPLHHQETLGRSPTATPDRRDRLRHRQPPRRNAFNDVRSPESHLGNMPAARQGR